MKWLVSLLVLGTMWLPALSRADVTLSGAGSTFAAPLYVAVAEKLGVKHQFRVAYDPVGSGEGLKRIWEKRVDFGASDRPVSRKELTERGMLQFPTAIGGVVVTANLPGINVADLRLDASLIGDLFTGRITQWDDARIATLNPGKALPSLAVVPVLREDSSGTSYLFSAYLTKRHPAWKERVGVTNTIKLPGAAVGRGNGGVVKALQAQPGSVGYLEFGYAQENKFSAFQMRNGFDMWVGAAPETIEAAIRAADWELLFIDPQPVFDIDTVDTACPRCWPIVGLTYVVVPRRGDAEKVAAFTRFVEAILNEADPLAREEGYVPLPSRAKNLVRVTLRNQMQQAAKPSR